MHYNTHLTAGLAAAWDCTADEVEKRLATKRKRSHNSIREDIPWTAARCNRLLRTITSRINILRKQAKLSASSSNNQTNMSNSQRAKLSEMEELTPPPLSRSTTFHSNDPEWVPGARSKPVARTYAGKCKAPVRPAMKKSDSGFSTPFVKRLLKTEECSTVERPTNSIDWGRQTGRSKGTRQLPVQLGSSNEEAQRNLVTAFRSLLTATSEAPAPERTGAPSLLSSCLRRVPAYISLEAEELDADDNASEDVCSSIYSELETLGTNSTGGWLGLREIVRAQTIQHIQDAIRERLIHDARITELTEICSRHGALREADALIQSWIARDSEDVSRKLEECHSALAQLNELRSTHHALQLYLRRHADLVDNHHVWISDILRPGSAPLKDMIKALIRGPSQEEALTFLEAAVFKDRAVPDSTSLPIFTRLAGLLVSIALTQASDAASTPGHDLATVVHRIAIHTFQSQDSEQSRSLHPFVMASALLHLADLSTKSDTVFIHIPDLITKISEHQSVFVKFTCDVVHHVCRFSNEDELSALLLVTRGFLKPPVEVCAEQRHSLSRVAFEIAFAYAEQTGVSIDQHFADSSNAVKKFTGSAATETPRRRPKVSGFKWEDGLCEWVAATPLLQKANEPALLPDANLDTPKQLRTPKMSPSTHAPGHATLVLPSSPDVIADPTPRPLERQTTVSQPFQPSRVVLKECSTNPQTVRPNNLRSTKDKSTRESISRQASVQVDLNSERERKPPQPIVRVEGKQVHLKEEKAKRAALLAAQAAAQASVQIPERKHRAVSLEKKAISAKTRPFIEDKDELGSSTPAQKRACRGSTSFSRSKSMSRISLARTMVDVDGMSDDELGL